MNLPVDQNGTNPPSPIEGFESLETNPGLTVESTAPMVADYRLLSKLGEGGMGEVWLAEQLRPIRRRVALKLIRTGIDSGNILARFEAERQALALMEHQNIAKVFDAGCSEAGRPFFVMEYVPGIPISTYCDRHKLSVRKRLELFAQVCDAIQHSHHKGVIHRDIKPSNVLVMLSDGNAVPKIIDYGLAKALQPESRLSDRSIFTEFGQVVGTLQYMSPEQAESDALDLDARTDIFSLGVLLYELMTGSPPIDRTTIESESLYTILKTIREEEPMRLSVKIATLGEEAEKICERRNTDLHYLKSVFKQDLDWIVIKALEKDRLRRYATVSALKRDIENFLNGEPIHARPPTRVYRIRKFVSKNRALTIWMATFMLSLAVVTSISSWFAFDAYVSRKSLEQSLRKTNSLLDFQAKQLQLIDIETIKKELENISPYPYEPTSTSAQNSSSNPIDYAARSVSLLERSIFVPTIESIEQEYAEAPDIQCVLLTSVGVASQKLGMLEFANRTLQIAVQKGRAKSLDQAKNLLQAVSAYGTSLLLLGKYKESKDCFFEAATIAEKEFGKLHPNTIMQRIKIISCVQASGNPVLAKEMLLELIPLIEGMIPRNIELEIRCQVLCASLSRDSADYQRALREYTVASERCEAKYGKSDSRTIACNRGILQCNQRLGNYDEAYVIAKQLLETTSTRLGESNSETLIDKNGLASVLGDLKQFTEAERIQKEVCETRRQLLGIGHRDTLVSLRNLAQLYSKTSRLAESKELFQNCLTRSRYYLGEMHRDTLDCKEDLSQVLISMELFEEAESQLSSLVRERSELFGVNHIRTIRSELIYALCLRALGRFEEASQKAIESISRIPPDLMLDRDTANIIGRARKLTQQSE